jgi:MFS family permease
VIKRKRFPKIYFGWWTVIVTAVISGLAGGFYQQGASALFKPIASDLGLNRAATSVATGIRTLQAGIMFPLSGWLSDKFGPKWVSITGICFMSTGLLLMNFINSAWTYYAVWGVIMAIGQSLGLSIAIDVMLTNWFVSKRGRAFSIRFAIAGIMGVIALPIIGWLIETQGWRTTCLIWAAVVSAGIPLVLYFVKQKRPEYYGLLPDGAEVEPSSETGRDAMIARGMEYAAGFQETEFTLRQALRTSAFWMLTAAWVIYGVIFAGFNVHCIPFLTDMDIDPVAAASMMAMMVFFTVPSRFIGGIIADHVKKDQLKFLLALTFIFPALGLTVFLLSQSIASVYIFLILFGFGIGAFVPLDIVIRSRYFGRKAYGAIQGSSVILSAPISFLSPIYTGWIYDTTGSYTTAFILFASLGALAAFIMCLVKVPKSPTPS